MSNGGPISEAGKAISSRNATRHGILSMVPVIPGMEEAADWEAHRAGIFESLAPEGHLEEVLAQRVAEQSWRLQRVTRYEVGAIADAQAKAEDDVICRRRAWEIYEKSPEYQLRDARKKLAESRAFCRRIEDLLKQPAPEPLSPSEAGEVVETLEEVTDEATRYTITVPFLRPGESIDRRSEWTLADLREFLLALAAADGQPPEQLLEKALAGPQQQLDQLEQRLAELTARVEQDRLETSAQVNRVRRERLLLSEKEMEKVSRYEAHLSRELYRALHELEACQARRHGQPAPLARLDISGLPGA